ncbi:MAG: hypothetical protein AAFP82_12025 [Bacteroidota bacterium]
MKYVLFFFLSSCFLLSLNDWTLYESKDKQFKILVPGELQEKIDTFQTDLGDLYYHTLYYQAAAETGNQVYMLSYCDYPEGTIHSDSTEILTDFFEETIQTAKFSINGDLMYQADRTLYGYPGKYWRIDYRDGKAVVKTKALIVKNRYYAIQVVATKEKHINPESDKFMESFRLLEESELEKE